MEIDTPEPRHERSPRSRALEVFGEVIPDVFHFSSEPTTSSLAKAFSRPELTPLHVYRAASHLPERVLREVVQILTYEPGNVAATAARLLSIMRGLPGNLELALLFLQQHVQDFNNFDLRTVTFFAFICGPLLQNMCDWGRTIQRAADNNCPESKLALSCLYDIKVHEAMEPITHLCEWESEHEHANAPSFWRELRWASFTRSLVSSSVPSMFRSLQNVDNDVIAALPNSYGNAAPHYVRICKNLLPRRSITKDFSKPDEGMEIESKADIHETLPADRMVITQSIRQAIEDISDYLACGVSFILEGPTGCGKSTILSYLAREVLYIGTKPSDYFKVPGVTFIQMDNAMISSDGDSFTSLVGEIVPLPDGGGFTWRPGPIGLAARNGDWLVFENISRGDQSTSSALPVLLQLAKAKPGDTLDAPGRGEPIRIAKGFRCIATRSTPESDADDSWEPPGGWSTWKRVHMQGLSSIEKVDVLKMRFASIQDCVERVVAAVEETARSVESIRGTLMRRPTMREAIRICRRLEETRNSFKALSVEQAVKDSYDVLGSSSHVHSEQEHILGILAKSWSLGPETVRDLCLKHRPIVLSDQSKLSIGRASYQLKRNRPQPFRPKLAINGHTSRLLEIALRSLQMQEHVLLVGEAGSGKTSVVQELASLLDQELVVVNLSRQSDIGDLIGGFKPLELESAVSTLGKRFELLFCQVMSKEKNTRFLDALQRACTSSQNHERAIRLMAGALKAFPKEQKAANQRLSLEWDSIAKELAKLQVSLSPSETVCDARAKNSPGTDKQEEHDEPPRKRPRSSSAYGGNTEHRLSTAKSSARNEKKKLGFAFSEGVLAKAMREGKWILLDEINLAPPELLERLVSVIDRGEVLLGNENGDVVSQAPGFFLFGAMNPPTDVGKRYLPEVLRARFAEIYVGDMIEREDVLDLVMTRLFPGQGSEKAVGFSKNEGQLASDITSFYIESSSLAREGHIEDNIGRPTKYSIRTLARMLDFAKGVSSLVAGGPHAIRRILYEGALLAFCTALPATSRAKVMRLASHFILRFDDRGKLPLPEIANMVPLNLRNRGRLQMVEGFPLENSISSSNVARRSPFVVSNTVSSTLKDVCRALIVGAPQLPILLQGPTAAGKTSMVAYLASLTGNRLIRINNHEHTDLSEYIGGYVATNSGSLVFSEGPLVKAAREGDWVMLDELNLAPPDVLESLNRLLDDNREIFIPETGETVKAAAGFRLFATQNPPGLYGGRKELSKAFRSRFVEVMVEELPDEDLLFILEKRSGIPQSFTRKMVAVMRDLQVKRKVSGLFSGREGFVTARDLFRWASRHPRSKEELAVYGFFLLGERCRISSERDIVRNVLTKHIRVSADVLRDESLYSLGTSSELRTAADECMHRSMQLLSLTRDHLKAALTRIGIALTPTTRRMLTLVMHCVANHEPVLLVGTTGGGKTTICSALCDAMSQKLFTVNCHQQTESSDILGGFRPVRHRDRDEGIFEWSDGPLVRAMREGCSFLIDEINMAEDAVIERLNSVLEPQRSLLLSERGAVVNAENTQVEAELVQGHLNFRILATMNPGGDYGKRELSPALRNRFTEIWIPTPSTMEDFVPIIDDRLQNLVKEASSPNTKTVTKIMVQFLEQSLRICNSTSSFERDLHGAMEFHISLRDLRAWCDFVVSAVNDCKMDPVEALMHGARVVFLDGLTVGGTKTNLEKEETRIWYYLLSLASPEVIEGLKKCRYDTTSEINFESGTLSDKYSVKVDRFVLHRNSETKTDNAASRSTRFCFGAPTTKRNIARLTRALAVTSRPILLEGPPGSGKSSLISALADLSGNHFTRINLSESTEMSDLVGTDAPDSVGGSFKFRGGPLLSAMKQGAWLLLDELNLASQSVLEGLNSVLDHRRTVFIPETNQSVSAHKLFRVFGAQNPVHGGGGRRGLPQSFLNRFTRVVVDAPSDEDILSIIETIYDKIPNDVSKNIVKALALMREDDQIASGSLTDFGLRDALRWCDVLCSSRSFRAQNPDSDRTLFDSKEYIRMSFDVSVLQGLIEGKMRDVAEKIFKEVFGFEWHGETQAPSLKAVDNSIRVGFGYLNQIGNTYFIRSLEPLSGILHSSLLRPLQAISIAVQERWPVVLLSGSNVSADEDGKRLVQFVGMSCGKKIRTFHGASLVDAETLIGGYSQRGGAQYMLQITAMAQELLRIMVGSSVGLDRDIGEIDMPSGLVVQAQYRYRSMHTLCHRFADYIGVPWNSQHSQMPREIEEFASEADAFVRDASLVLQNNEAAAVTLDNMASHNAEVWRMVSGQKFGNPLAFEWKKSELVKAIEHGEWIFVQGAEMCPPAVLDRLNPLFERPALSPEDLVKKATPQQTPRVLLAEAPSEEGGSPLYMTPHPNFRIFFSVSRRFSFMEGQGLSRPLLDRSLRICLEKSSNELRTSNGRGMHYLSSVLGARSPDHRLSRPVYLERRLGQDESKSSLESAEEFEIDNVSTICTRAADFVLHPELSCLDLDLWNFIQFMWKPERNFETAARTIITPFRSIPNGVESIHQHHAWKSAEYTQLYKRELLSSLSQAILLASSSTRDMVSRSLCVKKNSRRHSTIDFDFETAANSIARNILSDVGTSFFPCSIDPLYAMDRIPTEMIRFEDTLSLTKKLGSRAILFRAEILVFHRFQDAWKRAMSSSNPRSFFAQARLKWRMHGSGKPDYMRDVDIMCFELLASAARNLELTRKALVEVDGWRHPDEAEVYQIFDNLCTICQIMVNENPNTAYIWAHLHALSHIGDKLSKVIDLDLLGFSSLKRLIPQIQKLDIAIHWLTFSSKLSLIPRSKQSQLVEKQLLDVLPQSAASNLVSSEVDVGVKAVASLYSQVTEGNVEVIRRLTDVADSLKRKPESNHTSGWNQALGQFRSVVRLMAVRSMEDCLASMVDVSEASRDVLIFRVSDDIESLWSKVRCLPFFCVESLVAIMRLLWLLDSIGEDMKNNDTEAHIENNEQDLFLLALLRELNECCEPERSTVFAEVKVDSNPVKAIVGFLRAPQRYLFWNLEPAYRQAAATSGVLALNSRVCESVRDASFKVLFLALMSALRLDQVRPEAQKIIQDLEHVSFQDKLASLVSLVERHDSDENGNADSKRKPDEKLALSSVVQAFKVKSAPERRDRENLRYMGTAWISVGVYRLQSYFSIFDEVRGNDPSTLTEKRVVLSLETKVRLEARRKAYELLQMSRFGGDEFSSSIPAEEMSNQLKVEDDKLATGSSCHVYRDPSKIGFESFAGVVQAVRLNIVSLIEKNGFLSRAKQFREVQLLRLIPEARHLVEICKTTSESLGFHGSHSHFRDLSLRLRLGIEEIHHGLQWFLRATQIIGVDENPVLHKKVKVLLDLCLLPRATFRNASELPDAFSLSAEIAPSGKALMTTARFLLENEYLDDDKAFSHLSDFFSRVVKIWKASVERSEIEAQRRESLHVIRQSSQRNELDATAFLEVSEQQEVEDFVSTFNPIGNDLEDELLGLQPKDNAALPEQQMGDDNGGDGLESVLQINSSDFWVLHQLVFPCSQCPSVLHSRPSIQPRADTLLSFATELSFMIPEDVETVLGTEIVNGVWGFLCSCSVTQTLSGMPATAENEKLLRTDQDPHYNFYKDPNLREVQRASNALFKLKDCIEEIQRLFFKENGNHPVLDGIMVAIDSVARVSKSSTPLSIVVIGLENVLRKADEWNRLFATGETKLRAELVEVSRLVSRWRGVEMRSWPLLLAARKREFETQADKWVFLIYDAVINETLSAGMHDNEQVNSALSTIDRFLRSSPSGEFCRRLAIVQSISHHLLSLNDARRDLAQFIGNSLRGICRFYHLFKDHLEQKLSQRYETVLQELKEFTNIVSYNPQEELGSAVEMSKGRDKNLDYFRLKALSDKTRRRVHKLCLKVDGILRVPFYEHMMDFTAGFGFDHPIILNGASKHDPVRPLGQDILTKTSRGIACDERDVLDSKHRSSILLPAALKMLSRFDTLRTRLVTYGREIQSSSRTECEAASAFSSKLRTLIRARVSKLREMRLGSDIQPKRRALIDLLKGLSRAGLSPFERPHANSMLRWLSTSDPSSCEVSNKIANHLYFSGIHQYQTLRNVSDSSTRNNDISAEEAGRIRAFCRDLLDKSAMERTELNKCSAIVHCLSKVADALTKGHQDILSTSRENPAFFGCFRDVLFRLRKAKSTLQQISKLMSEAQRNMSGDADFVQGQGTLDEVLCFYRKVGKKSLSELQIILNTCCDKIGNQPKAFSLMDIDHVEYQELAYFDGSYKEWCETIRAYLSSLKETLHVGLSRAREVSEHNLVTEILSPLLSLVEDGISEESPLPSSPAQVASALYNSLLSNAEELVHSILISSQKAMAWNGVRELLGENKSAAPPLGKDETELFPEGVIRRGHDGTVNLGSYLLLTRISSHFDANSRFLQSLIPLRDVLAWKETKELIGIQNALGSILKEYLRSMLMPCLEKAIVHHHENLALLRTLTNLFIGICKDGFCRPDLEEQTEGMMETEVKSGTGFGDVGNGDMSGAQDVSEAIEDEEQLLGLRDERDKDLRDENENVRNEDGFDMKTDFEGTLEDVDSEGVQDMEGDGEAEKQMGQEHGKGENILNEKLWDSENETNKEQASELDSKQDEEESESQGNGKQGEWAVGDRRDRSHSKEMNEQNREEEKSELDASRVEDEGEQNAEEELGSYEEPEDLEKDASRDREHGDHRENGEQENCDTHSEDIQESGTEKQKKHGEEDHGMTDGYNSDFARGQEPDPCLPESDQPEVGEAESNCGSPMVGVGDEAEVLEYEGMDEDQTGDFHEDCQLSGLEEEADMGNEKTNPEDKLEHVKKDVSPDLAKTNEEEEAKSISSAQDDIKSDGGEHCQETEGDSDVLNGADADAKQPVSEKEHRSMNILPGRSTTGQADKEIEGSTEPFAHQGQGTLGFGSNMNDADGERNDIADRSSHDHQPGPGNQINKQNGEEEGRKLESSMKQDEQLEKGSSSMNTNPLRLSDPEHLIKEWNECLRALRDDDEQLRKQTEGENDADAWQYETIDDPKENPQHSLGAATQKQQRPLPDERVAELDSESIRHKEAEPKPKLREAMSTQDRQKSHFRQEQSSSPQNPNESLGDLVHGDVEKPHPVRSAIDRERERNRIASAHIGQSESSIFETRGKPGCDEDERNEEPTPVTSQVLGWRMENLDHAQAKELWHALESKVASEAATLCEQMRLVLEPTKASRMGGGYRTGKRLNMRKVIEYVASDFRKDRIWLRRVKPDKRSYDVLIAIDDSASMLESEAGVMATESLALVISALSKLEVGRIAVASFGSTANLIRHFEEPLPINTESGAKLLQHFTFSQTETNIVNLLSFIHSQMGSTNNESTVEHISLALVISDGRLSHREEVRRQLRILKESNVLVAFFILDRGTVEENSIYNVQRVEYEANGKMSVRPYMHDFPIDFYAVVQNMSSLPGTLADALRQWIEITNYQ